MSQELTPYEYLAMRSISSLGYTMLRYASGKTTNTEHHIYEELEAFLPALDTAIARDDISYPVASSLIEELNATDYFEQPTNPDISAGTSREAILVAELTKFCLDVTGDPCPHLVEFYRRGLIT